MIPHTSAPFPAGRETLSENTKSPASWPDRCVAGGSAELLGHQGGDFSTELLGSPRRFGLREDADQGFGAGRPHEYAARAVELRVDLLNSREELVGQRPAA